VGGGPKWGGRKGVIKLDSKAVESEKETQGGADKGRSVERRWFCAPAKLYNGPGAG